MLSCNGNCVNHIIIIIRMKEQNFSSNTNLKARILKAVRSNFPGDTGNFRQNIGSAISMSLDFSSPAFQLAPIFKLFNFKLSFVFAIVVVVDEADDDVAAVFVAPSPTEAVVDDAFGTCF